MWIPVKDYFNSAKLIEHKSTLFLLIFLALAAIAMSVWQGYSYFKGRIERAELQQNAIGNGLTSLQQRSGSLLAGNVASLHIVASSTALKRFVDNEQVVNDGLHQLFRSLIESNSNVYQIRYIDQDGSELIRIEKRNNEFVDIPTTELQNKKNRQYFNETLGLNSGEIYVSSIDLNLEAGKVVEPWIPTIRFSTPVFDSNNNLTGILIINVDVSSIIALYHTTNANARVEVMLANSEGFWIYGRPQQDLWGFALEKNTGIFVDFPGVWDKVQEQYRDTFEIGSDSWTYQPARVSDLLTKSLVYSDSEKILWYALVKNPPFPIAQGPASFLPPLVILIALLAFSWGWAKTVINKRRTEKELVKSEKMSSLGGLVAGVAHELNTPIGSAVTIASTMQEQAKELHQEIKSGIIKKSQIIEFISGIEHGVDVVLRGLNRAIELISHFKQIAVDQSGEQRRQFALDEYIKEMTATFKHLFNHRAIDLELDLQSGVTLDSYPGALSQVIINLVQNALIHGFNEHESGTIRIITRVIGDDQLALAVEDNGMGIPPQFIDRLFEPFFTTKLGQGGSGLGLHIVYNIAHEVLNGELTVVSNPEKRFTQFTLLVPMIGGESSQPGNKEASYVERTAA